MKRGDVDFVVTWVDGSDPEWRSSFEEHAVCLEGDKKESRFRDWPTLKYLFRGFEECAPWVRKVHFVTCGHLPSWLDESHPKLNVVNHSDFLEGRNLPVFSSHPIEINLHRIEGLSEQFVYFNDDTFLLQRMSPCDFFKKGVPRDMLAFNAIAESKIAHVKLNDVKIIHKYFSKKDVVFQNFFKIFNYRYNLIEMIKTALLMPWPVITGFYDHHLPQPFLKKTFSEVWEAEPEVLTRVSASKLRSDADVNQYLFRYWHLCKGQFQPIGFKSRYMDWVRDVEDAKAFRRALLSKRYKFCCIGDAVEHDQIFEECQKLICEGFESLFPKKSGFEL